MPTHMQVPFAHSLSTFINAENLSHSMEDPATSVQEAVLVGRDVSPELAPYFVNGVLMNSLDIKIRNPVRRAHMLRTLVQSAERMPEDDRWYMFHHSEKDPGLGSTLMRHYSANVPVFDKVADLICSRGEEAEGLGKRPFYYYSADAAMDAYGTDTDSMDRAFEVGVRQEIGLEQNHVVMKKVRLTTFLEHYP